MKVKILILLLLTSLTNSLAYEFSKERPKKDFFFEKKGRGDFLQECRNNKKFVDFSYKVRCGINYHHYNSRGYKKFYDRTKALEKGDIKISEFNVLHPGMSKTRFKDYKKLAQIMKNFDIIGVTELIPLMGDDYFENQKLIDFINTTPSIIGSLKDRIKALKRSIQDSKRGIKLKRRNLILTERKLQQIQEDLRDAKSLYRRPGYLKILDQLHKMHQGDDWALILSPMGEGSKSTPTKELVGYYYKSSLIKPKVNKYCKHNPYKGRMTAFACIINLDENDMGEDKASAFARRPFLAEFISGHFSFSLLTSHILFDSPKDEATMKFIMQKSFGVDSYLNLGTGLNKHNYARFAEVKMTLDFIQKNLKGKGHQKDIIYMGDLNLRSSNKFWPNVLSSWPEAYLFINQKTSLTKSRYTKRTLPTFGKANNYDHFIFDPIMTDECVSQSSLSHWPELSGGGVYDFVGGKLKSYINRIYKIRYETREKKTEAHQYRINKSKYQKALKRFVFPKTSGAAPIFKIAKKNITYGKHQLTSRGIVEDKKAINEYAVYFKKRVLDSQLYDQTYYSYFKQIISDHYPIYMSCSTRG